MKIDGVSYRSVWVDPLDGCFVRIAHNRGLDVHVWIDETRPRNQGAVLTPWELGRRGMPQRADHGTRPLCDQPSRSGRIVPGTRVRPPFLGDPCHRGTT